MKVLVGCEYSGVVRRAFRARGHDAWSCDLLPAEDDSPHHYQCDVELLLHENWGWDLLIAHPPCTHLARSGARWLTDHWVMSKAAPGGRRWHDGSEKRRQFKEAVAFVRRLANAPVSRIAIENPRGMLSTHWRKPDQEIQPWMFGHGEMKTTALWLKNLPNLVPSKIVDGREQRLWKLPPQTPERWKERSRTYPGIGAAMAEQWGATA